MPRACLALLLAACALQGAEAPVSIGGRKQLFIDGAFVRDAAGVAWRMNPPIKAGLTLQGENTWEDGIISGAGAIMEDGGRYRFWYTATPATSRLLEDVQFRLCYAESADGVHWTKPNLGLYSWQGSTANNILMETQVENGAVFLDPAAPPAERYKIVGRLPGKGPRHPEGGAPQGTGVYLYASPDGLHWTLRPERVFPFDPDTVNMALYDRRTGKYLAYVRTWNPQRRVGVLLLDNIDRPWPFRHDVPPRPSGVPEGQGPILAPTRQVADAFGADASDPPNVDHYTAAAVAYPWADDAYFLFPSAYQHFPEPPVGERRNDGPLDIQLAVSRDGLKYHRISHQPYIELGLHGARDSAALYMYVGMLRRGDEIYQYYGAYDYTHGEYPSLGEIRRRGGMFRVVQRLDGFVSLDADESGGHFTTPLLTFSGRRLVLNLNASATGEAQVELRDAGGKPIPGHAFADADMLYQNDTAKLVTWRHGQYDLGALAGQPVRIAFRLRSAKLYAFQFVP